MHRRYLIGLFIVICCAGASAQDDFSSIGPIQETKVKAGKPAIYSFASPQEKNLQLAASYAAQFSRLEVKSTQLTKLSDILIEQREFLPDTIKSVFPPWEDAYLPVFKDAARYNMKYLDVLQGLNSSYVVDILGGPDGYMWLATLGAGICRYDGNKLQNFTVSNGLRNDRVYDLDFDSDGNLWYATRGGGFGMFDGTFFYNYMNGGEAPRDKIYGLSTISNGSVAVVSSDGVLGILRGTSFMAYDLNKVCRFSELHRVFEEDNGTLWITTDQGFLSVSNGLVTTYDFGDDNSTNYWGITETGDGIWFSGSADMVFYDGSKFQRLVSSGFPKEPFFMGAYEDSDGSIWLGTYGYGIFKFDNDQITKYDESDGLSINYVWTFHEDNAGNIWMGTDGGGLAVFSESPLSFLSDRTGLSNSYVMSIAQDEEGGVWLATYGGGINRIYDGRVYVFDSFGSLDIDFVYVVCRDQNGKIWAGTDGDGLLQIDIQKQEVLQYKAEDGMRDNTIRSLYSDAEGNLWIGTESEGLVKFDGEDFTSFSSSSKIEEDFITAIVKDMDENIWVATDGNGLFEISKDSIRHYSARTGFFSDNLTSILVDRTGGIWIGSQGSGVARIGSDLDLQILRKEDGLSDNIILSITEEKMGRVWLATNRGITMLTSPTLSTTRPLYPSLDKMETMIIDENDGLKSVDFFSNSALIDANNTLWLGSGKNVTRIDLSELEENGPDITPSIFLTEIQVDRERVQFRNKIDKMQYASVEKFHNYPHRLIIDPEVDELDFVLSAIYWQDPNNIHYSYKLWPEEENWNKPTRSSRLNFKNLEAGNYRLIIRASHNLKNWSEPFEYEFVVLPQWYLTWWAYTSYAVAAIVGFFILIRLRTRQLERRKIELEREVDRATNTVSQTNEELVRLNQELLEQRNELERVVDNLKSTQTKLVESEKMASLGILSAGMAHEINNPLNFIKGGVYSIRKMESEGKADSLGPFLEAIEEGVNRASTIVRSLNHFSRQGTSMNEICDIHMIIDNCIIMMHNEAKYRIDIQKQFTEEIYEIRGNEGQLHQVFLNILTNAEQAIDDKGIIHIQTEVMEDDEFLIRITDTGEGISTQNLTKIKDPFFTTKAPGKGTGLGLSISHSIIENHGGRIIFESTRGEGTRVSIILPLQ